LGRTFIHIEGTNSVTPKKERWFLIPKQPDGEHYSVNSAKRNNMWYEELGEIYVTLSIMVLMTFPSDPPLPPNRTLCCCDRPASPPMHTTSFTCTTKVGTNQNPGQTNGPDCSICAKLLHATGVHTTHYIL